MLCDHFSILTLEVGTMERIKKLIQLLQLILIFSCIDTIKNEYPQISDMILKQYPMYVNTSPNGTKILLKNRNKESFDLIIKDASLSRFDTIDRSDFTQLSLTWHPNGSVIFFQEFNPETRKYDLYKIDRKSKKRFLIGLPPSRNAISPLRWSKNGRYLAYLSIDIKSELIVYDYDENEIIRSFPNVDSYADFQWSGDSTFLYIRNPKEPILKKINLLTGVDKEISLIKIGETTHDFSIKKSKVLFIGRKYNEEYFQCFELDIKNENIDQKTFGNFNISNCTYSKNSAMFYYSKNENGVNRLYSSDSLLNNYFRNLSKDIGSLDIDMELKNNLFIRNHTFHSPPSSLKIDTKGLRINVEYEPINTLDLKLKKPKFLEIARENTSFIIPSYYWKANYDELDKKTIIYVHGGPYLQEKPLWNIRAKILNDNGFNILSINYHGSSGYSQYFEDEKSITNQILDIIASVNYLKEMYSIDQKNIILVGSSYGGNLVLKASPFLKNIGGIVLISAAIDSNIINIEELKKIKLIGFYGDLDPITIDANNFFKRNNLINKESNNFKVFKNEGHFFHKSMSWTEVYGLIIESYSNKAQLKSIQQNDENKI